MAAEDVCDLLGHRWAQPEGPSKERLCARCGRLRTWWSATSLAVGKRTVAREDLRHQCEGTRSTVDGLGCPHPDHRTEETADA